MPNALTLIATQTASAGTVSAFDFTAISGIYTDLYVTVSGRSTFAAVTDPMNFIFESLSGYTMRYLQSNGTAASSGTDLAGVGNFRQPAVLPGASATANVFGSITVYVPNYTSAIDKTYSTECVTENNATAATTLISASKYVSTGPVARVVVSPYNGSFAQWSTASVYGVLKGSGGATVTP